MDGNYIGGNASPFIDCARVLAKDTLRILSSSSVDSTDRISTHYSSSRNVVRPLCKWSDVPTKKAVASAASSNEMRDEEVPARLIVYVPSGATLSLLKEAGISFSLTYLDPLQGEFVRPQQANDRLGDYYTAPSEERLSRLVADMWVQQWTVWSKALHAETEARQDCEKSRPDHNCTMERIGMSWRLNISNTTHVSTSTRKLEESLGSHEHINSTVHTNISFFPVTNRTEGEKDDDEPEQAQPEVSGGDTFQTLTVHYSVAIEGLTSMGTTALFNGTTDRERMCLDSNITVKLRAPQVVYASCATTSCMTIDPSTPEGSTHVLDNVRDGITLDASATTGGGLASLVFTWQVISVVPSNCSSYNTATRQYPPHNVSTLTAARRLLRNHIESVVHTVENIPDRKGGGKQDILHIPEGVLLTCTRVLFDLTVVGHNESLRVCANSSRRVEVEVVPIPIPSVTIDGCYASNGLDREGGRRERGDVLIPASSSVLRQGIKAGAIDGRVPIAVGYEMAVNLQATRYLQPVIDIPSALSPLSQRLQFIWELYKIPIYHTDGGDNNNDVNGTNSTHERLTSLVLISYDRILSLPGDLLGCLDDGDTMTVPGCPETYRYVIMLGVHAGNFSSSHIPHQTFLAAEITDRNPARPYSAHARISGGSRCAHTGNDIILDGSSSTPYPEGFGTDPFAIPREALVYRWSCWFVDSNYLNLLQRSDNAMSVNKQCTDDMMFSSITHEVSPEEEERTASRALLNIDGCQGPSIMEMDTQRTGTPSLRPINASLPTLTIPRQSLQVGSNYKICLEVFINAKTLDGANSSANSSSDSGGSDMKFARSRYCIGVYIYIPGNYSWPNVSHPVASASGSRGLKSSSTAKVEYFTWSPLAITAPFITPTSSSCSETHEGRCPSSVGYWMNAEHALRLVVKETRSSDDVTGTVKGNSNMKFPYPLCKRNVRDEFGYSVLQYTFPNTSWNVMQIMPKVFQMRWRMVPGSDGTYHGVHVHSLAPGMYQMSYTPYSFMSGAEFSLSLGAHCGDTNQQTGAYSEQRGRSHITVGVRAAPRHGYLVVHPADAISLETELSMRQDRWLAAVDDVEALPLQYTFYYGPGSGDTNTPFESSVSSSLGGAAASEDMSAVVSISAGDICLREWMEIPHARALTPYIPQQTLVVSNSSSSNTTGDMSPDSTYWGAEGGNTSSCWNMSIAGYVRDTFDSVSVRRVSVHVCRKATSINTTQEVPKGIMGGNRNTDFIRDVSHIALVRAADYVYAADAIGMSALQYSLGRLLNTYRLRRPNATELTERRAMRERLLQISVKASELLQTTSIVFSPESATSPGTDPYIMKFPSTLYSDIFGYALLESMFIGNELNEFSKSQVLSVVLKIIHLYLGQSTPSAALARDGYANGESCRSVFFSLRGVLVEHLLQALDRSGPLTNHTFASFGDTAKDSGVHSQFANWYGRDPDTPTTYKETLLGLKRILVGCLLSGESTARGMKFANVAIPRSQSIEPPLASLNESESDRALNRTLNISTGGAMNISSSTVKVNMSSVGKLYMHGTMPAILNHSDTGNSSVSSNDTYVDLNQTDVATNSTNSSGQVAQPPSPETDITNNVGAYVVHMTAVTLVHTLFFGGSQIAAERQSSFFGLSDASVELAQDHNGGNSKRRLDESGPGHDPNLLTAETGGSDMEHGYLREDTRRRVTEAMESTNSDGSSSSLSFLKLPCDATDSSFRIKSTGYSTQSAPCGDYYESLSVSSADSVRTVSVKDAIQSSTGSEGYIDISIINVAQFLEDSDGDDADENVEAGEIRSWIPHMGSEKGASDAVIVDFRAYGHPSQHSIVNISRSVEVSLKVSRSDVFWRLVTTSVGAVATVTAENMAGTVDRHTTAHNTKPRDMLPVSDATQSKQSGHVMTSDVSEANTITSSDIKAMSSSTLNSIASNLSSTGNENRSPTPRWVRCEVYDDRSGMWNHPKWLDGWWSPDVVSFATSNELNDAALYHRGHDPTYKTSTYKDGRVLSSIPVASRELVIAGSSTYLILNTSLEVLPSSLSCFINALYLGDDEVKSLWLQWRVVTQSSDPCGGCSGHGTCVLFRTAPVCLCDDGYTGRFCDEKIVINNSTEADTRPWSIHRPFSHGGLGALFVLIIIFSVCGFVIVVGNKMYFASSSSPTEQALFNLTDSYDTSSMTTPTVLPSHTDLSMSPWVGMALGTDERRPCSRDSSSSSQRGGRYFGTSDYEGSMFYTSEYGDIISTDLRVRHRNTSGSFTRDGDGDYRMSVWDHFSVAAWYLRTHVLSLGGRYYRTTLEFDNDDGDDDISTCRDTSYGNVSEADLDLEEWKSNPGASTGQSDKNESRGTARISNVEPEHMLDREEECSSFQGWFRSHDSDSVEITAVENSVDAMTPGGREECLDGCDEEIHNMSTHQSHPSSQSVLVFRSSDDGRTGVRTTRQDAPANSVDKGPATNGHGLRHRRLGT